MTSPATAQASTEKTKSSWNETESIFFLAFFSLTLRSSEFMINNNKRGMSEKKKKKHFMALYVYPTIHSQSELILWMNGAESEIRTVNRKFEIRNETSS